MIATRRRDLPRHVMHVVPALFDEHGAILGGAERYAFELARHMADVVRTTLVSFGPEDGRERHGRLDVRILGRPWYVGHRFNPVTARLVPLIAKADVVHCHQQRILASNLAAAVCRTTGRRVFVSDLGGGGWDVSNLVSTDRWFHGHLHISEFSRRIRGQEHDPRARVILGGVDIDRFSPDVAVTSREARIVFVGRLLPHKGIDAVIEALPNGLGLDVIGRPHDERYLADLRRLAAGRDVRFRHDCDDDAITRAYRSSLAVVLPSVHRTRYGDETAVPELLGQTLLEGMACGTPGLATKVASLPEVVADGETGLLVPPHDRPAMQRTLERLRDHPGMVRWMGRAARRRVVERFRWESVVARCLEAYRGDESADREQPHRESITTRHVVPGSSRRREPRSTSCS